MATFTEEEWAALPETSFGPPTEAEHWRRVQARAEALHAERMAEAEERAKRNAIEIGKIYSIKPKRKYERENEVYRLLVKVVGKNPNWGEIAVRIIRDYDYPHFNKVYSEESTTPIYVDFHKYDFNPPSKKELIFADKRARLNHFKQKLRNLRTAKRVPLPNNVKGLIGSYLVGNTKLNTTRKVSLKNQEKALKEHIKALEANLSNNKPSELIGPMVGGTNKRRFKSSKRKTT
jgi:hypothetical protein